MSMPFKFTDIDTITWLPGNETICGSTSRQQPSCSIKVLFIDTILFQLKPFTRFRFRQNFPCCRIAINNFMKIFHIGISSIEISSEYLPDRRRCSRALPEVTTMGTDTSVQLIPMLESPGPSKKASHFEELNPHIRDAAPSKIERDLTNGPLSKLVELLDTQVCGSVQ